MGSDTKFINMDAYAHLSSRGLMSSESRSASKTRSALSRHSQPRQIRQVKDFRQRERVGWRAFAATRRDGVDCAPVRALKESAM